MRYLSRLFLSLAVLSNFVCCYSKINNSQKVDFELKAAYFNLEKYELLPGITLIIEINNMSAEQVVLDFNKTTGVQKNKFIFVSKETVRVAQNYGGNEILMAPGFHWMLPFNVSTTSEYKTMTSSFSYEVNVDSISHVYTNIINNSKLYLLTLTSDNKSYDTLEIKKANDFQAYKGTFSMPLEVK